MLSDSIGWGGSMKNIRTKILASIIMLIGMTIAVFFRGNVVNAIVFAQASTLFGFPVFALVLMLILNNKAIMGEYCNRWWENILAFFGICLLFVMMLNTYFSITTKIWLFVCKLSYHTLKIVIFQFLLHFTIIVIYIFKQLLFFQVETWKSLSIFFVSCFFIFFFIFFSYIFI